MRSIVAGPLCLGLGLSLAVLAGETGPGPQVRIPGVQFVATTGGDLRAFMREWDSCRRAAPLFTSLTQSFQAHPLLIRVVRESPTILGSAFDRASSAPMLTLDLGDLNILPSRAETRRWQADSSWAITRCVMLGYKLGQGISYREEWDKARDTRRHASEEQTWFTRAMRRAQSAGQNLARMVRDAEWQTTPDSAQGASIQLECYFGGGVVLRVGDKIETIWIDRGRLIRITYEQGPSRC